MIEKELTQRNSFGFEEIIRFLLKAFLINLERIHKNNPDDKFEINNLYELQFLKFKELVEENYKNGLSVKQYAEALNISTKTLGTITKSAVNKSPLKLISERMVLEAKRLLKFTTYQIGEVAYKIGFDDASYFVKFFKRNVGNSPKDYRKNSAP